MANELHVRELLHFPHSTSNPPASNRNAIHFTLFAFFFRLSTPLHPRSLPPLSPSPSHMVDPIAVTHALAGTYHWATRFSKATGGTARDSATIFSSSEIEQCTAWMYIGARREKHTQKQTASATAYGCHTARGDVRVHRWCR